MFVRLFLTAAFFATLLSACDCIVMPAKQAKRISEVVFRSKVAGLRESDRGDRIVIFQIERVWKGRLGQQFEMPALEGDLCFVFRPFLLKAGNDLIVYASRLPGGSEVHKTDYYPAPCNTGMTDADGIQALGRGRKPARKSLH